MGVVWGTVVILDLDKFEDIVKAKGWSRYSPNPVTGELSRLVEEFVRKWNAYVVYGLDWKRGTEEAVIEIPLVEPVEIMDDLENIRREIEKLGVTISIGVAYGPITGRKASNRRDAYKGYTRKIALKALKEAKRLGGNRIIVLG